MASTPVEVQGPSGQTLTLRLYPDDGSDVVANGAGGDTLTEYTNALGLYQTTVDEALTGMYYFRVTTGAGAVVRTGWIYLEDLDSDIYRGADDYYTALKLFQMTIANNRVEAALADADGIAETVFRTAMMAFAFGPNTVTDIDPDNRQIQFKKQDGSTVVVDITYDPADGQRVGVPTITP